MADGIPHHTSVQGHAVGRPEAAKGIVYLARAGYAAKGVVYMLVGVFAAMAAFGSGGQVGGSRSALAELLDEPFGQALLGIIAFGLLGFAIWRWVQVIVDPEQKASGDKEGYGRRAIYLGSAVIYTGLCIYAAGLAFGLYGATANSGGGGGGGKTEHWTGKLMAQPAGKWLVVAVGVIVAIAGLVEFGKAYKVDFTKKLDLHKLSHKAHKGVIAVGRAGLAARGVVFLVIGWFFIQAGWQADASEAGGLGQALNEIQNAGYGPWLLGLVAIGLVAYGVFQWVKAAYRRFEIRNLKPTA